MDDHPPSTELLTMRASLRTLFILICTASVVVLWYARLRSQSELFHCAWRHGDRSVRGFLITGGQIMYFDHNPLKERWEPYLEKNGWRPAPPRPIDPSSPLVIFTHIENVVRFNPKIVPVAPLANQSNAIGFKRFSGGNNGFLYCEHFVFSTWIPIAVFSLPLIFGLSRVILRRRPRPGHCPHCHYDLRASTNRCPECGTPIPPSTSAPQQPNPHP